MQGSLTRFLNLTGFNGFAFPDVSDDAVDDVSGLSQATRLHAIRRHLITELLSTLLVFRPKH